MAASDAKSPDHPSTPSSSPIVFQAEGITKIYKMGEVQVQALRGVDLDLRESEFVVLLGPSGSGKSTLLNILGGLDVPTRGTVQYKDQDLTAYKDAETTRAPLQVSVGEEGKTRVIDRYVISAPVAGTICRITLDVGDHVEENPAPRLYRAIAFSSAGSTHPGRRLDPK